MFAGVQHRKVCRLVGSACQTSSVIATEPASKVWRSGNNLSAVHIAAIFAAACAALREVLCRSGAGGGSAVRLVMCGSRVESLVKTWVERCGRTASRLESLEQLDPSF